MIKRIRNSILLMILLFINISPVVAEKANCDKSEKNIDAITIKENAPKGLKFLATQLESHQGIPENKGAHGSISFCYQTDVYVVYSSNTMGEGYELSKSQPKNLQCLKTAKLIKSHNQLDMYVGMPKAEVEKLLKLSDLKNNSTIIWQTEATNDKGVEFTVQTYVNILFKEEKLEWLSVFTTETM